MESRPRTPAETLTKRYDTMPKTALLALNITNYGIVDITFTFTTLSLDGLPVYLGSGHVVFQAGLGHLRAND